MSHVAAIGQRKEKEYMNICMYVSMLVNLSPLALLYSRVPLLSGYGLLPMLVVRGLALRC